MYDRRREGAWHLRFALHQEGYDGDGFVYIGEALAGRFACLAERLIAFIEAGFERDDLR